MPRLFHASTCASATPRLRGDGGIRGLVQVDDPVPDVLLQRALQGRVAARDRGVVAGADLLGGVGGGVNGQGRAMINPKKI